MSKPEQRDEPTASPVAGEEDLRRILGDIEDTRILEILALSPTVAEIEIAGMWAEGKGDIADHVEHPLAGKAARICEILVRDEELPDR